MAATMICRFDVLFPADLLNHLVQQIGHSVCSYNSTTKFALRIPSRGNSIDAPLHFNLHEAVAIARQPPFEERGVLHRLAALKSAPGDR